MKLNGKVAIVTGGAQGIGKAIAMRLAGEGAAVVISDVNYEKARLSAKEIKDHGGRAIAVKTDVTNKKNVQDLMKKTIAKFKAIHIMVNNAGIMLNAPIIEMSEETWDAVVDIDLKGVFLCTQAVAPYMMEQRYGKIVNISSIDGMGHAYENQANYAAAKAGVIQLTKVSAREFGPYNINVNSIAPGKILTDFTYAHRTKEEAERLIEERKRGAALGRIGGPRNIADLVFFLVSEDSEFITGQVIRCDGGRTDGM